MVLCAKAYRRIGSNPEEKATEGIYQLFRESEIENGTKVFERIPTNIF